MVGQEPIARAMEELGHPPFSYDFELSQCRVKGGTFDSQSIDELSANSVRNRYIGISVLFAQNNV